MVDSETVKLRVCWPSSLTQLSLQICQTALAVISNESPTLRSAGAVISVMK